MPSKKFGQCFSGQPSLDVNAGGRRCYGNVQQLSSSLLDALVLTGMCL